MPHLGFREWKELFVQTAKDWSEDKVPRLGAAMAFYTALSMAPLLVIALRVAAYFFGDEAAAGEIERQAQAMIGKDGAEALQAMIENADEEKSGTIAAVLGIVTLLFGASGVFGQLQDSMNTIWEVQPKPGRGIWGFVRDRFLSFAMVMGCAFLLLVSLVVTTMLSAAMSFTQQFGDNFGWLATLLNEGVSLLVITGIFAVTFKMVPDVKIAWRDVWIGAVITALLFAIGKFGLSMYLSRSSMASSYGVAGSLIVLLVWVYYSAQIVFFGAEFTQVYANKYGSRIVPSENAIPVTEEARAQQGMPSPQRMSPA
ncbi:MAG TPA: YihY/virulence factor BrkB family protein [Caulifigura sp.]|jgi:membrane protein|nr:YihY/virulence factor BrkB family protein [Caulifigura sp.]